MRAYTRIVLAEPTICVCAALQMAGRRITREYNRFLAPAGLTVNQFSILARLRMTGPSPLSAAAARLGLDRTSLSRDLRPLVATGLVEIDADEDDRRKRVVSVTEAGVEAERNARPLWRRAQVSVAESFGPERTEQLLAELNELATAAR
jgi:DNA-binding MarR family transcriptional regulator